METIKKFAVFLIFILLINNCVYAEEKKKEVELSESIITITLNYQRGNDVWAENTLNLLADIMRLMEEISGVPYPASEKSIYASENETKKAGIKICEFTDEIKECENGFGIEKTQDTTTTVRQIASIWNTNYFEKDWLSHGHTSLYTYLVLKEINLTEAEKFKTLLFLNYNYLTIDFPLNEWSFLGSVTSERQINKRNYGISKSFVFMHLVYKNYGSKAIIDTRRNLNKNEIVPDSVEYKEIFENVTNKNLDNLFSGWIFSGEYKIRHEEIKEIEIAMQKYDEVFAIYNKSQSKELYNELMNLRAELYEKCDIEKSIERADELIKNYKEIEIAMQRYNELIVICNESQNKKLCDELIELRAEFYDKGNIEKFILYADELIKMDWTSKNETTGHIIEEDLTSISNNKYNEAKKLYDERGIFAKIGLMFYNGKTDIDKAKTELYKGNFAASKEYSERAISDIGKSELFGMVVVSVILLIFSIFLIGVFLRRG